MKPRTLVLALLLAAPPAAAQEFIYGLNMQGKLTVNGTVLDSLPTAFDPDTGLNKYEKWFGLDVVGPNRYALRIDGRIQKNGKKLYQFQAATDGLNVYVWRGFDATVDGVDPEINHVHALRQEGLLNTDGVDVVTYPRESFFFTQLAVRDVLGEDTVYVLRSDGTIFTGTSTSAVAKFTAAETGEPGDGSVAQTVWIDIAVDPLLGELLALRADGELWKEQFFDIDAFIAGSGGGTISDGVPPAPPSGQEVAELPFPLVPGGEDFYANLEVALSEWRVLRADGALFTDDSVLEPFVDYAGTGNTGTDENFYGLALSGTDIWALRDDGLVFKNDEESDPILNLTGADYTGLVLGSEPPDLTNFKNPPPKASPYTVKVLEGEAVSVPVIVSDIEKTSDDLVVQENPDVPLPPGATFVEVDDGMGHITRTLEWDGTQPAGTYPCKLTVDDDDDPLTKPEKFTTKIKVLAADIDPLKNKPPAPSKVKKVQALVGHEIVIPILAEDVDGDAVTISVNTEKKPFTLGATFDDVTNTFSWTPTFDHIGNHSAKFKVTDGTKTKTLTVKLKVKSSLIFEEPEP